MAVSFSPILHLPHSLPSPPPLKSSRTKISATASLSSSSSSSSSASQMDLHNQGRQKFIEFPFVSAPHRDLMVNLLSTVEDRLGSHLLPCTLPLDVQHCQNESGSAQASLHIRSGLQSSQVISSISLLVAQFETLNWFVVLFVICSCATDNSKVLSQCLLL